MCIYKYNLYRIISGYKPSTFYVLMDVISKEVTL